LLLSREMALVMEREFDGLRVAFGKALGVLSRFEYYGVTWNYGSELCVALGHGRLILENRPAATIATRIAPARSDGSHGAMTALPHRAFSPCPSSEKSQK
jgi:hypothetical protein